MPKLQSSARNSALGVINNNKKKQEQATATTASKIDSRTRSMMQALQGRSIFGPETEDSIFQTTELGDRNMTNSKRKAQAAHSLRYQARSVQKVDSTISNGIFGDFPHQSVWMNQSQVVHEQNP